MGRQQAFDFKTHGGKRDGAGRKRGPGRPRVPHTLRAFGAGKPMHVTLRAVPDVGRLRRRHVWKAVQWALVITVARPDFRICHVSIQGNHVHLIVEADDRRALARGMQGFQISCAKQLNARIVIASRGGGACSRGTHCALMIDHNSAGSRPRKASSTRARIPDLDCVYTTV